MDPKVNNIAPPPRPQVISSDPEVDSAPQITLPVGMKIDDRYEILGTLGVGGFATVYRAHHLTIDRDVALKVMDTKKGVDPSYSERFFREAKIAAKIHHANVVSIYDFGHVSETGQPYIAMEMLSGRDLSHELEEVGPLSPRRMYVLFRPVLDALAEGHRLGIVHKDLKPENLYLIDPGGPREMMKILDFGVARVNSNEMAKLTTTGQLLGTPRYLAPEYIKTQAVSPAIDVYQMALIISEALTGISAVSGDPFHAMMLHCSGKLQISEFLLEGPVGEVFRKAISIDPEKRYQDCGEFAQALDSLEPYFKSNVPLKGGAPQIVPDTAVTGRISSSYSGSQITGSLESPGNSGPYAPPNKKKILLLLITILAVLGGVIGAVVYKFNAIKEANEAEKLRLAKQAEEAAAAAAAIQEDVAYKFKFKSTPDGAAVRRKGNAEILCLTPCSHEFMAKPDSLSQWITFDKDGFEQGEIEITSALHAAQNGKVEIELNPIPETSKELVFIFDYSPKTAEASILKDGEEQIICKLSPCNFTFNTADKAVTVTFTASGYVPQNIMLTEDVYIENPTVKVALEKKQAAPSKPKENTPAPVANTPPECKEGEVVCESKQVSKSCKGGKWKRETCPQNKECYPKKGCDYYIAF